MPTIVKPTIDKSAFAARLVRTIKDRDLTIVAAAARCGMSLPSLESYIYRQALPGCAALAALAQGLGVSTDYLLLGSSGAPTNKGASK